MVHFVEGYNIADFDWGKTTAKAVTLSFWVRGSVIGNYSVALRNYDANRAYATTYTINSANTWEYKTITIPGETTGTWYTDNNRGIELNFDLGRHSSYETSSVNTWNTAGLIRVAGTVRLLDTQNANFYITGVQLEKGSQATAFDYRPFGTELTLCQRYFEKNYPLATVPGDGTNTNFNGGYRFLSAYSSTGSRYYENFKVPKRASPTMTFYKGDNTNQTNGRWGYYGGGGWASFSSFSSTSNEIGFAFDANVASGFTGGYSYLIDGGYTASAEL
jgi:hypothetical protein